MGMENLAPTSIWSPDRPARSESLYRLHCSDPYFITNNFTKKPSDSISFGFLPLLHTMPRRWVGNFEMWQIINVCAMKCQDHLVKAQICVLTQTSSVLFNNTLKLQNYGALVMDDWISMEHWWNNIDRAAPKYSNKNLSLYTQQIPSTEVQDHTQASAWNICWMQSISICQFELLQTCIKGKRKFIYTLAQL
jgi:hypothetical protein